MSGGWNVAKLADVCVKISDGTHHSPDVQFREPGDGRFKYVTSKNIRPWGLDLDDIAYVNKSVHREIYARCNPELGDVLLTKDGANTGNVAINTLDEEFTRLCAMNLLLHGIGSESDEQLPVVTRDALGEKHGEYRIVLANPPFGKKSSVTIVNDAGETSRESLTINRADFWASTSNKQLNFVQHIWTILEQHGRAAVVVPDNVLFEGGAGETVRRELLRNADVHTLLRLPTGIFYAQGVKANVLFFERKPANAKGEANTRKLWIYDLRTNMHFTLKENTLKRSDLDDFVTCYNTKNRNDRKESERFKCFDYEELVKRDKLNLDIFWLKDEALEESANLPPPDIIAAEIAADLEAALEQFATIAEDLKK